MKIRNRWQLQTAKAKLSALVQRARKEGPQEITVRGEGAVVVLSHEDYERLLKRKPSLVEFLRQSPLREVDLTIERDKTPPRDIDL
ncbi:antitoxin Phd [Methylomarinovum tepidoasis]|uniref:Antitoxin n=1 Tax=Methylomarinovum tepidoasis TaxID=2840183 RepID=A0AAU9CWL0_9GAMM|nr:type II toxin-antitoxin system Phd/YefM family antitoxin [Methylomarinovum sp. IN45]BCX88544.1 antitoxin Phd [Methylomarinovum sp. IN45]